MKILRFQHGIILVACLLLIPSNFQTKHTHFHPKSRELLDNPTSESLTGLSLFEELSDLDKTVNSESVSLTKSSDDQKGDKKEERELSNQKKMQVKTPLKKARKLKKKMRKTLVNSIKKEKKERGKKKVVLKKEKEDSLNKERKLRRKKSKKKRRKKESQESLKNEIEGDLWKMLHMQDSKKEAPVKKEQMGAFLQGLMGQFGQKKNKKTKKIKKKKKKNKKRKLKKVSVKKDIVSTEEKVEPVDQTLQFLGGSSYDSTNNTSKPTEIKEEDKSTKDDQKPEPTEEKNEGFFSSIASYFTSSEEKTETKSSKSAESQKNSDQSHHSEDAQETVETSHKSEDKETQSNKSQETSNNEDVNEEDASETNLGLELKKISNITELEEEINDENVQKMIKEGQLNLEKLEKKHDMYEGDMSSKEAQEESRDLLLNILTDVQKLKLVTEEILAGFFLNNEMFKIYKKEFPDELVDQEEWRNSQSLNSWVNTLEKYKEVVIEFGQMQFDRESIHILNEIEAFHKKVSEQKYHDLIIKFTIDPEHSEFTQKIIRESDYFIENYEKICEFIDLRDEDNFPVKDEVQQAAIDFTEDVPKVVKASAQSEDSETVSSQNKEEKSGDQSDSSQETSHVSQTSEHTEPQEDSHVSDQSHDEAEKDSETNSEKTETSTSNKTEEVSGETPGGKYQQIETDSHGSVENDTESESLTIDKEGTSIHQVKDSSKTKETSSQESQENQTADVSSTQSESHKVSSQIDEDQPSHESDHDEDNLPDVSTQEDISRNSEDLEKELAKEIIKGEQSELEKEFDEEQANMNQSIPHGHDFNKNQMNTPLLPNNHIDDHPMMRDPYQKGTQNASDSMEYESFGENSQNIPQEQVQEEQSDHSLSEMIQKLEHQQPADTQNTVTLPIVNTYQTQKGSGKGVYSKAFINLDQGIKQSGNEDLIERNYLIQHFGEERAKQIADQLQREQEQSQVSQDVDRIPVIDMSSANSSELSSYPTKGFDHHANGINVEHVMSMGKLVDQNEDNAVDLDHLMDNLESHNIGSFEHGQMGTGQTLLMKPLNTQVSNTPGSYTSGNRVPLAQRFKSRVRVPVITVKSVKQMVDMNPETPVYSPQPQIQRKYPCPQQRPFIMSPQPQYPVNLAPQQIPLYNPVQMNLMADPHYQIDTTVTAHPENETIAQFSSQHPREDFGNDMGESLVDSLFMSGVPRKERRLSLKPKKIKKKMKSNKHLIQPENLRRKVTTDTPKKKMKRTLIKSRVKKKEHFYQGKHKKKLSIYRANKMKIPVITMKRNKN
jgi:hypothetical protein